MTAGEPESATIAHGSAAVGSEIELRLTSLLAQSLEGDKAAYRIFLHDLSGHLRARLRKKLRRADADIEDLVQEILIAVHKGLDTFRPDVPLTAWISAIVRYKVADYHRTYFRRDSLHEPLDDDGGLFVDSSSEISDARRDVEQLLATLPMGQRLSIVQTRLWGMSVAEAASSTGLSESAVKVGVHRGLKALAAKIRGKGHEN